MPGSQRPNIWLCPYDDSEAAFRTIFDEKLGGCPGTASRPRAAGLGNIQVAQLRCYSRPFSEAAPDLWHSSEVDILLDVPIQASCVSPDHVRTSVVIYRDPHVVTE